MFMKGRIHVQEIFQKFKCFPNIVLGVSPEKLFSKCNKHEFLKLISI